MGPRVAARRYSTWVEVAFRSQVQFPVAAIATLLSFSIQPLKTQRFQPRTTPCEEVIKSAISDRLALNRGVLLSAANSRAPCQSGRRGMVLAACVIGMHAQAGTVNWAHLQSGFASNGSVTVKSLSGGTYTGTQNPSGTIAKTNQSAVTQPPTVIVQATANKPVNHYFYVEYSVSSSSMTTSATNRLATDMVPETATAEWATFCIDGYVEYCSCGVGKYPRVLGAPTKTTSSNCCGSTDTWKFTAICDPHYGRYGYTRRVDMAPAYNDAYTYTHNPATGGQSCSSGRTPVAITDRDQMFSAGPVVYQTFWKYWVCI